MNKLGLIALVLAVACGGTSAGPENPDPDLGNDAPTALEEPASKVDIAVDDRYQFSLPDLEGTAHSFAANKGKLVVVEWFNPQCPFVKYAYNQDKGPLRGMARREIDKGDVVWFAINSGAPGKQGHDLDVNQVAHNGWEMAQPILRDVDGKVGRAYGAKSTPHVFVFGKELELIYKGALDNAPLGKANGEYMNYVAAALEAARSGDKPAVEETPSYGCGVKY